MKKMNIQTTLGTLSKKGIYIMEKLIKKYNICLILIFKNYYQNTKYKELYFKNCIFVFSKQETK